MPAESNIAHAHRLLLAHLREEKERGTDTVYIADRAGEALKCLPRQYAARAPARATPRVMQELPEPESAPGIASGDIPAAVSDEYAARGVARLSIPPGAATLEEKLAFVRQCAMDCAACREIGTLRDTMVFAVGNPRSSIMFVGEAPGFDEERQREPFVGRAGQKLTAIIQAMGVVREDVYISNIVKYRPSLPGQTTNNRAPTAEEMATCLPFIFAEIELISPKAIVALGKTSVAGLLNIEASLGSVRNRFHSFMGIPVMPTYHPSYILRSESKRDKRMVWEDMLMVMEHVGLPIAEKQRRYFL